jgi:hypothetical protein
VHCRQLFQVGFSIFGRIVHFIDRLFDVPKEHWAPNDLFLLTPGDEANAGMGFGQRFATKVVKGLGARTLQEGQNTADSIAFGNILAGLAIGVAEHSFVVWKESRVLQRWRAKRVADAATGQKPRFWRRGQPVTKPIEPTTAETPPPLPAGDTA